MSCEFSRGCCHSFFRHAKQTGHDPSVVSASMRRLIVPDSLIRTDPKIKELSV